MPLWFWDASALAKRYTAEVGREVVNRLFELVPGARMAISTFGYAETYAILVRRRNGGLLDEPTFATAATALQLEMLDDAELAILHPTDGVVFDSLALIHRHNLNSTDAVLLSLLLAYSHSPGAEYVVVIASDRRLLRAAAAEGMATLNPEEVAAGDVEGLIASLAHGM